MSANVASNVPRLLVVSSCSAIKRYQPPRLPGIDDLADPQRRAKVEERLARYALPAREQYSGRQHRAVVRSVDRLRAAGATVDLVIVSAGYGIVDEHQSIVPYDARFAGLSKTVSLRRARQLGTNAALRTRLPAYDVALFLLSDAYLSAIEAPFAAAPLELYLASSHCTLHGTGVVHIPVGVEAARRLGDASRTAKGTLFSRFTDAILTRGWPRALADLRSGALLEQSALSPMLSLLTTATTPTTPTTPPVRRTKFFVPDWDDRVDPGYDFVTDRFSLVRDPYRDDVYAHELLTERVYDGILVSRMALGEAGPKRELVDRIGMRAYLRQPADLELLGDCGAFGYIEKKDPIYDTADVIDYYHRLGFDYGVSVDHLIVTEFESEKHYRYDLTLRNAEDFLRLYHKGQASHGYRFTPIGAVQGWDVPSYVAAAKAVVELGYDYIALGGLARSNTKTVNQVVSAVHAAVPPDTRVHVFGIARLASLPLFLDLGIASIDSAAPLRQAWLSAVDNYYTLDRTYAAIRIPIAKEERAKPDTLVGRSTATLAELQTAERDALAAVRAYDRAETKLQPTFDAIMAYDRLLGARLDAHTTAKRETLYRRTLRDRPWKHCPCEICRQLGVQVIIFRGNNRNRRRGFHNLWMVRQRMRALCANGDTATD